MFDLKKSEVWFVTGSQHLYGPETLNKVAEDSRIIAEGLNKSEFIPVTVTFKPVLTTPESIHELCLEANSSKTCIGIITWMHTFSPAQMWIAGLRALDKPFAHLHTQYNREIPWSDIDMDFMNLNQSAHGDREFGFIGTRMRLNRKVVVGHWKDGEVQRELGDWARAACALHDWHHLKIARFGDNMRDVAVTEGDKVAAQMRLGFSVSGYGVGDLVKLIKEVDDASTKEIIKQYLDLYQVSTELMPGGTRHAALLEGARIELGMRRFLESGGFGAFTTTFEDLNGLNQLPGLAVQRLMADGYGFGAEGDWKTAALVRAMKVMGSGLPKGCSFMEDYTYHFSEQGDRILGAHMLEVCSSIAAAKPVLEILPLSIGGKSDPVRLIFDSNTGDAVAASLIELGDRFRLIVNVVEVVPTEAPLPKLPVARAFWIPKPDLRTASSAWIMAGGAHHTGFSFDVTPAQVQDFAEMLDMEMLLIDNSTTVINFKKEIRWNEVFYNLSRGF
jgi:L-arabinose isomerase